MTWHQDKTIAVSEREDIKDWGPWSLKEGIHHVQPSLNVLEQMVTFRLHLDVADETNGCLKLIPGSHRLGILGKPDLDTLVGESEPYLCQAQAGDLLIMRPHLLHASSKASQPSHRRILHIEYSSFELPQGLSWG